MYIFSGSKVIAEYDNGAAVGSPSREYIYSGGTLLAKIENSATVYYHQDGLSARIMTDSSGNKLTPNGDQGHYPFGELWYPASALTKWLFTTYERDAESTNDYAMARYYRDALGRFNSPDPLSGSIGDPQSLNRYSYSRNDPLDLMDPSGMDDEQVATDEPQTSYSEMYVGDNDPEELYELVQETIEIVDEVLALEDATHVTVNVTTTSPLTDTEDIAEANSDLTDFFADPGLGGGLPIGPRLGTTTQLSGPKCPPVPNHPANANLNKNMAATQSAADAANEASSRSTLEPPWNMVPVLQAQLWFYNQVKEGGPWDYKRQGPYDDFGNFNYGATGGALFTEDELLAGATAYKWYGFITRSPVGNPGLQPEKAKEIKAGYEYYANGCDHQ